MNEIVVRGSTKISIGTSGHEPQTMAYDVTRDYGVACDAAKEAYAAWQRSNDDFDWQRFLSATKRVQDLSVHLHSLPFMRVVPVRSIAETMGAASPRGARVRRGG